MGVRDRVERQNVFPRVEMFNTTGHTHKVGGEEFKGDVRGNFFKHRLVGVWSALPSVVVVEAETIGMFKALLDKHANVQGIEGYASRTGRKY